MTALLGQTEQTAAFRGAMEGGHLHHAWLLTGPEGVGKASFAMDAARWLLANGAGPATAGPGFAVPEAHPIAHYLAAGSHPDFRRLERLRKDPEKETSELARNISVGQVRQLQPLFGSTGSLSRWRVVIIDAIDHLEPSAANALLKNLEEPPPDSLFLLVSHAPGRLLPTIRSRCRQLRFVPLADDVMTLALRRALPDAEPDEIAALVAMGQGAPGRALTYAGLDLASIDATAAALVTHGDPGNGRRVALAKQLSGKAAQLRYEAFLDRAPSHLAAAARERRGQALADTLALWEKARALAESAVRLSLDPQTTVFELAGLLAGAAREPLNSSY